MQRLYDQYVVLYVFFFVFLWTRIVRPCVATDNLIIDK
jgi:hypothetical protein